MSTAEFREVFQRQVDGYTSSRHHQSLDMARADGQLSKLRRTVDSWMSRELEALGAQMTEGVLRRFAAAAAHIPIDSERGLEVPTQTAEDRRRSALEEECRALEAEVARARADKARLCEALASRFQSRSALVAQLQARRLEEACRGASTEGTAQGHQDLGDQFEQCLARMQDKLDESLTMAVSQSERKGNLPTQCDPRAPNWQQPTPGAYVSCSRGEDTVRLLEGAEDAIRSLEVDSVDRDLQDAIRKGQRACSMLSRHLSEL